MLFGNFSKFKKFQVLDEMLQELFDVQYIHSGLPPGVNSSNIFAYVVDDGQVFNISLALNANTKLLDPGCSKVSFSYLFPVTCYMMASFLPSCCNAAAVPRYREVLCRASCPS